MSLNYQLITGAAFIILGLLWSRDDLMNFLVKLLLVGLGVWGIVEGLK